jgi:DNA-binding CsgD family transcriptional regulator
MNISMWRIVVLGMGLAFGILILKYLEYRYILGKLSVEFYTGFIALGFLVIGLVIGKKVFFSSRSEGAIDVPEIDSAKIKSLEISEREYEILKLIKEGLTNQEIADRLFIALPTVKTHTSNLYSKLGVNSRTLAISKATELNIL